MTRVPLRRQFTAIVNPASGPRSMLPVVERVAAHLQQSGAKMNILISERPGHPRALAAGMKAETEAVLIVGGDGTVGDVIQGLDIARIPFLVLKTGTENLLAKELAMPSSPQEVAETLLMGEAVSFDLGMMNRRRFASLVGVGFDAECVKRLTDKRTGHISHFDYVGPIWQTFWTHRFPRLTVEVDGDLVFDGHGFVIAGNIARYARNMRILRDARWNDGLLDVAVFPCTSRATLFQHAVRVLSRRHIGRGGVIYAKGRTITVRSPDADVPIETDGDIAGHLPMTLQILPGAARFLRTTPG